MTQEPQLDRSPGTLGDLLNRDDHPTVKAEYDRHLAWGHTLVETTTHSETYRSYLCSCGIGLTASRFED